MYRFRSLYLPETVLILAKACLSKTISWSTVKSLMALDRVSMFSAVMIKTHSGHTHYSVGAVKEIKSINILAILICILGQKSFNVAKKNQLPIETQK